MSSIQRGGEVLTTDTEYWNATDVDETSTFYKTWMVLGRAERCAFPHVHNFDAKSFIASLVTREGQTVWCAARDEPVNAE